MGLPYVADPAVTKHLAAFLKQHAPANEPPDAILFNGGVFQPESLRDRLVEVMRGWYGTRLEPARSDVALARPGRGLGRGLLRLAQALRRRPHRRRHPPLVLRRPGFGGLHVNTVLCVVPRHLEEGEEIAIAEPELELALGEPVSFPLFTSTVRGDDKPGDVLQLKPEQVKPLPPLHTILRGGKRAGVKRVPDHARREVHRNRHARTLLRREGRQPLEARIQRPRCAGSE